MPFGLKMSQIIFQMKMDMKMEKFPGIIIIHSNMAGYDKNEEDNQ